MSEFIVSGVVRYKESFLLPAVVLPTMRVPPTVAWITGMKEPSSDSKTL